MVWVSKGRLFPKLEAVFPEADANEAIRRWNDRDGSPRSKFLDYALEFLRP